MKYIELPKVIYKLNMADKDANIVIVAATGYGKTALRDYYFSDSLLVDGKTLEYSKMPRLKEIEDDVLVIENASFITDKKCIERIYEYMRSNKRVVLCTRSKNTSWISSISMELDCVYIWEKDLKFGRDQIEEYMRPLELSNDTIDKLLEVSHGYPLAIRIYYQFFDSNEQLNEGLVAEVWERVYKHFDANVFEYLDADARELLLAMSPYESFDVEFARQIIVANNINNVIEHLRQVSCILDIQSDGKYIINKHIKKYLNNKRTRVYSEEIIRAQYRSAANYFERYGMIEEALKYYNYSHEYSQMERVLIKNTSKHPGNGHYYELRKYYMNIPDERIYGNPALMAAMSMINSLLLNPDESERWYGELVKLEKSKNISSEVRRTAKSKLVWLDISLGHRCGKGIIGIMKNASNLLLRREVDLPPFSVTSNMPSAMNGGLDFSEWSKIDVQLARFMGKPVERILGKAGKGIVNIALAESGFEKGSTDSYRTLTYANNGYFSAASEGTVEVCFAAIATIAKQHLVCGQYPTALKTVSEFRKSVPVDAEKRLFENIDAFETYLQLYKNSKSAAQQYLEIAPDGVSEFYILERFRYMIKLRCFVALGMNWEAVDFSLRLERYFTSYGRTIFWIENRILRAIALYRLGDLAWEELLETALIRASEYNFVRTVSLMGNPVLPLLLEHKSNTKCSLSFYDEVVAQTRTMARMYPEYLYYEEEIKIELTAQEERILGMLCQGLSLKDISDALGIKYASVKVHNHNIYQKFGVSSRSEAERMAVRLGIVHRE